MNKAMHVSSQAHMDARYLAMGGAVYAVVTAVWLGIALALDLAGGMVLLGVSVPVLILLLLSIQMARVLPPTSGSERNAAIGKWFGIIFAGEGALIGVGSGVLLALGQPDLILSWVALIVGLHFFPLGYLLGLNLDYLLGAAIVLLATVTLLFDLATRQVVLTFGTVALLWLAGVARLAAARSGRSAYEAR